MPALSGGFVAAAARRSARSPSSGRSHPATQPTRPGYGSGSQDLAHISPYLTEHINRFGEYSTHELGIQPEAYDPKLDVDFTALRDGDLASEGFGQAA